MKNVIVNFIYFLLLTEELGIENAPAEAYEHTINQFPALTSGDAVEQAEKRLAHRRPFLVKAAALTTGHPALRGMVS
jgi:hypothetical protein